MDHQAAIALIHRYLDEQQWEAVIQLCHGVLESQPGNALIYRLLGRAHGAMGQLDAAIYCYGQSLEFQPNQVKLYADLGYLYHQRKNFAQAIAYYQKALSYQPHWVEVRFNLAVLQHQLGDWDTAIDHYQKVIYQKENHLKARFNLASLYEKQGQLKQAEELYTALIPLQPTKQNLFSDLGNVFFRQGRYAAALAHLEQALSLAPESATILNNLGQVLWRLDQREEALDSYQQAIERNPMLTSTRLFLGRLWRQHQLYKKAEQSLILLCEQHQDLLEAHHELGLVSIDLGNWSKAFECFRTLISKQSEFVDLFCQRTRQSIPQDHYEKAQYAASEFLLALQHSDTIDQCLEALFQSYYYLGQALLEYGALNQAEGYFHKALHLKLNAAKLYHDLGCCLVQQKRFDAALSIFSMGLVIHPHHPLLSAELGRLLEQARDQKALQDTALQLAPELFQNAPRQLDPDPNTLTLALAIPSLRPLKLITSTKDWVETHSSSSLRPTYIEIMRADQPSCRPKTKIALRDPAIPKGNDCGGVTCGSCMSDLISLFEPKQLGHNFFQCSFSANSRILPPATFVVQIPNGQAWISPQSNAWLICKDIAIITPDRYLLGDLSRFYPWYLPRCSKHNGMDHPTLKSDDIPHPQDIEGTVAILSGLSGHVFYHWMIDVIPRIGLLQASGIKIEDIDWFVVNSLTKPFQTETLQTLGIPLEKIIESDRIPSLKATTLVVPSFPGHLDWVPSATIDFLRHQFLTSKRSAPVRRIDKRIYISRSQAKYRQVVNEPEVIQLLEQFGFVSVSLEGLSVREQAHLFASADVIVSPHGAALTNLVFCTEGTQIVEIFSPNYVRTDYWMISQQRGLDHYYIIGNSFQGSFLLKLMHQNALTEDISLEMKTLYLAMHHLGLSRQSAPSVYSSRYSRPDNTIHHS